MMFAATATIGSGVGPAFWWVVGITLYLLGVAACYVAFLKTSRPDPETSGAATSAPARDENDA